MWKIVTTAISVFLLLGNVMGSEGLAKSGDYQPREFWEDGDTVKQVFSIVVPKVQRRVSKLDMLFECSNEEDWDLAERIANKTYSYIQKYMKNRRAMQVPTREEVLDSIGIYYKIGTPVNLDEVTANARVFLDYVSGFLGESLY